MENSETKKGEQTMQKSMKDYRDYYSTMTTSFNKGMAKGRAEGKDETKREHAIKMKELGISPEMISQVTGLTVEEVEKL